MADWLPTYEYEGDRISAHFEGREIASGNDFGKVAETAEQYLESLREHRQAAQREARRTSATHIETPNGLKGEILTRASGVFGDEITVRFENGRIARLETAAGDSLQYSVKTAAAPANYREAFEQRLAAEYAPTREGLNARLAELAEVRHEARNIATTESSVVEQKAIHQLILAAEAEELEIKDVLAHLDAVDAENATPAAPQFVAAEQASLGRGDGGWLEHTAREMIAESEAQDFDKILAEEPAVLAADMDDAGVADAGVAREIALSHIIAKTAGFQGEAVEAYREQFVAAVETERRRELKSRSKVARVAAAQVEASLEGVGDEALFF